MKMADSVIVICVAMSDNPFFLLPIPKIYNGRVDLHRIFSWLSLQNRFIYMTAMASQLKNHDLESNDQPAHQDTNPTFLLLNPHDFTRTDLIHPIRNIKSTSRNLMVLHPIPQYRQRRV